jgi:DUF4097 and DUF4098 domain-containing protein YvlB
MRTINWILAALFLVVTTTPTAFAESEENNTITRSLTVSKGGRLDLSTEGGDVRVDPWEKNEVLVRVYGISERDSDRVKIMQEGNNVSVRYRSKWAWISGRGHDVNFQITVPSQYDVQVETSGGDIQLNGTLTGDVKVQTSGGDIRMENIVGNVNAKTSGGDVTMGKVQGNGTLKTSGGDIKAGPVSGELEAVTSGGDISAESTGKKLVAKTAGGDIVVGDVGGEATVSTAGGDIKVGKVGGKATLSTAGGDIELKSAWGAVTAKTAGGDIRLENVTGSVEAKTAGGDVMAELNPSGKGGSKLSSAGGDITLYVPENCKANIDARIRIHGFWGGRQSDYEVRSDFKADSYDRDKDGGEIRAIYVLNGGGESIALTTVNANIEIRKLKK